MAILTPALSELTPKAEPFRVVVIGRLTPAKFIEEGLAAFADVRAAVAGSQLDIAGGGDPTYQDALEEIVRRRGLADAVTFHGRISEVDKTELLTRAHVHLFTSHREGWGLTVNEAGARGTPTVGYSVPGVRDSVRDPRLLATLADGPAGLAQRIVALRARIRRCTTSSGWMPGATRVRSRTRRRLMRSSMPSDAAALRVGGSEAEAEPLETGRGRIAATVSGSKSQRRRAGRPGLALAARGWRPT